MIFAKVHTIRNLDDGVRAGTADFDGVPHHFACVSDYDANDLRHFQLSPVSAQFMERELRHWTIFREWEAKFHLGLAPLESHPGHGGVHAEYDLLGEWLEAQIMLFEPIHTLYAGTFRPLPGQEKMPVGILRELEVCWAHVSD